MANSAVEALTLGNTSDTPVSFYDYYNAYGQDHASTRWMKSDPYSLASDLQNFFKGTRSSALKEYENYLSDFEYKKNQAAVAKQNAETYAREDSQVQRAMADYLKAGVNPYALVMNGSLGSVSSASQASAASYKKASSETSTKKSNGLLNTALKILALIVLKGK